MRLRAESCYNAMVSAAHLPSVLHTFGGYNISHMIPSIFSSKHLEWKFNPLLSISLVKSYHIAPFCNIKFFLFNGANCKK